MQRELSVIVTAVPGGWEIQIANKSDGGSFEAFANRPAQIPHRIGELLFRFDWAPEKAEANKS